MQLAHGGRATLAALIFTAMSILFSPTTARAEIVTMECSGDVTGTFIIDFSIGTVASYHDNKAFYLTEVEITASTISFLEDHPGVATETVRTGGTASNYRIDRATGKVESQTYDYMDNKVTDTSSHVGQCKKVPNPK